MVDDANEFRLHEQVVICHTDNDDDILEFVGLTGTIRHILPSDLGILYVVLIEEGAGVAVLLPCSADQLRRHNDEAW